MTFIYGLRVWCEWSRGVLVRPSLDEIPVVTITRSSFIVASSGNACSLGYFSTRRNHRSNGPRVGCLLLRMVGRHPSKRRSPHGFHIANVFDPYTIVTIPIAREFPASFWCPRCRYVSNLRLPVRYA